MFDSKDLNLYAKYLDFVRRMIADEYSLDSHNWVEVVAIKKKCDDRDSNWIFTFSLAGRTKTRHIADPKWIKREKSIISYHKWLKLFLKEERNRRLLELLLDPLKAKGSWIQKK